MDLALRGLCDFAQFTNRERLPRDGKQAKSFAENTISRVQAAERPPEEPFYCAGEILKIIARIDR